MGSPVTEELAPAPGAAIKPPVDEQLSPAPNAPIVAPTASAPPAAAQNVEPESISDPMAGEISPDSSFVHGAKTVGRFFRDLGRTAAGQAEALGNGLMMGTNVPLSAALQHTFTGEPYEQARARFQAADLARKESRDLVGRGLEAVAPAITASLVPGGALIQGAAAGAGTATGESLSRGDDAATTAKHAFASGIAGAAGGKLAEIGVTAMTNAAASKVAAEGLKKWATELRSTVGKDVVLDPAAEIAPGFTVGKAIENYTPLAAKGNKEAQSAIIEIVKKYGKQGAMTTDDVVARVAGSSAPASATTGANLVHGLGAAAAGGAAVTGHLGTATAMAGAGLALKGGKTAAQWALVNLIKAKAAGSVTADMVNQAIQLGVPRMAALGAAGLTGNAMGR